MCLFNIYCNCYSRGIDTSGVESNLSTLELLRDPKILLSLFGTVAAMISTGFVDVTLGPYLHSSKCSPLIIELIFTLVGVIYSIGVSLWGMLGESGFPHRCLMALECFLEFIGFILIRPTPFIHLNISLTLINIGLTIHGIGDAAEIIASFAGAQNEALEMGFPDDLSTFGMVSDLWSSALSLGFS